MRILKWLCFAKRPFKVEELRHALALEWEEDEEPPTELDRDNIIDAQSLLEVTAGLASIHEESGTIRLAHFTTQEYLNKHKNSLFPDGESEIVRVCIAYMSLDDFASGPAGSDDKFNERRVHHPFYTYCCSYWGLHLRGPCEKPYGDAAMSLLSESMLLGSFSQAKFSVGTHKNFSQHYPQNMTSIHVIAVFGLDELLSSLDPTQYDLDVRDSRGRTVSIIFLGHHSFLPLSATGCFAKALN